MSADSYFNFLTMTYSEAQALLVAYGRSLNISGLEGRSLSNLLTTILISTSGLEHCLGSLLDNALAAALLDDGGLGGDPGPAGEGPDLLTAEDFAILAGSTVTNTGNSVVDGDLGLSPGTSVTGFPPGVVNGTQHITDATAAQAQLDLTAAYLDLEGRTGGTIVAGNIGGQTLSPGIYKSTSSLAVSSGELTLDAGGNADAVFIFQIASTLDLTPGRQVILAGGAQAKNIFWQVGSSATLDTTSVFKGSILALTSITVNTGADVEGRLLARNGAVTIDDNAVVVPV